MTTAQWPEASKPQTKCSGTRSLKHTTSVRKLRRARCFHLRTTFRESRVCCLWDRVPWLVISDALPQSKGCWDAAGVACQSPDRRDGKQTDYARPDRHERDLWPNRIRRYTTRIRIPKKTLKIPKIPPSVWPQIIQTGTNMACFPNIPETLQSKRAYQIASALLLPANVFIKSNTNKIRFYSSYVIPRKNTYINKQQARCCWEKMLAMQTITNSLSAVAVSLSSLSNISTPSAAFMCAHI